MSGQKKIHSLRARRVFISVSYLVLFLLALLLSIREIQDFDLWWHLKAGEWIVEHGSLPVEDPFSFTTSGKSWHIHKWGFHCLMYGVFSLGGFSGLILVKSFLTLLTLVLFLVLFRLLSVPRALRPWLLFAYIYFCSGYWMVRPQVFEYCFVLTLMILVVHVFQSKRYPLYLLPLLFLFWVNFHGSFVLGLGFLGIVLVERWLHFIRVRKQPDEKPLITWFTVSSLFSILATLINPFFIKSLTYPFGHYNLSFTMAHIVEWQPPALFAWTTITVIALVSVSILTAVFRRNFSHAYVYLWVLVTMIMALKSQKHFPLVYLTALPAIGCALSGVDPGKRIPDFLKWLSSSTVILVSLFLGVFLYTNHGAGRLGIKQDIFPAGPVHFIRANHPSPNLFNITQDGGYLIFYLWPEYKVFIDGRLVLHGDETMMDSYSIMRGDASYKQLLSKYDIKTILVRYRMASGKVVFGSHFHRDQDWALVYLDSRFALFVNRLAPENAKVINEYEFHVLNPWGTAYDQEVLPLLQKEIERVEANEIESLSLP